MAPSTLLECFDEEHPIYRTERREEMAARKAKASSTTTEEQEPPTVLIHQSLDHWLYYANTFLHSGTARRNYALTRGQIPLQMPCSVASEQDVVNLSTLYLVYPLMMAIEAKFPGLLTQFSEYKVDGLRVDLSIKSRRQANPEAVMLLEFKRCWYIHIDEFARAMCHADQIDDALDELYEYDLPTTLEYDTNAYWFVKQVTAYYVRTGCRYAALCDYEHLILIKFGHNGSLESAKVTIVPRSRFRKALLGFLIEACWAARVG